MDYSWIGTVAIPGISLIVSVATAYYFLRDRRHTRYQMETAYVENLLAWHKEVVFCLMRLEKLPIDRPDVHDDLCALSALIEQGRFFFPNIVEDKFGESKPLAYRGYRNIVLQLLVDIYRQYSADDPSPVINEKYRKSFTSAVFSLVDPVSRISEISKLSAKKLSSGQSTRDYINAEWR
ncbi:hypothetical protein AO240_05260 [Pseudomonas sp. ICMP 460]|nr:hypothetical protein AO240_05260 [Pseudomonas sp. ICMP 460]